MAPEESRICKRKAGQGVYLLGGKPLAVYITCKLCKFLNSQGDRGSAFFHDSVTRCVGYAYRYGCTFKKFWQQMKDTKKRMKQTGSQKNCLFLGR